jgi:hypothetical protein
MGIDLNRFRKNKPSEWVAWLSDEPLPANQSQPTAPVQPQIHQPASYAAPRPAMRPVSPTIVTPARPTTPTYAAPPGLAQSIAPPSPVQSVAQPHRPAAPRRSMDMARQVVRPAQTVSQVQPAAYAPPQSYATATQPALPQGIHQTATNSAAAVSIQISMPKFRLPKLPELPYRKIGYWAGGSALVLGLSVGGWITYRHFTAADKVAVKGASTVTTSPTFKTFAPQDKPQLGAGTDLQNTAYDGQRGLYTYKDVLMGFPIVVSQQTLPDNIKKDPSKLRQVAQGMGANVTTADTAYGTVYIATDKEGKAQRGVFAHGDVLLLVQSYKPFDTDTWKYYVETLRQ